MRAEPPKNMGFYVGNEDYKAKRRIMQAPGGETTFSLGYDTSSPFEFHKSKYNNELTSHSYAAGIKVQRNNFEGQQRISNHHSKVFQSSAEFQNTFHASRQTRSPGKLNSDKVNKPYQTTYASMNVKSWKEVPNMFADVQSSSIHDRRLAESGNISQVCQETEPLVISGLLKPSILTNNVSQPECPLRETRSRSQISSVQNNYNNIMNDFSPKPSKDINRETSYSKQFRTTNDFAESKIMWSGKKIVQPPGGSTSIKFWG